MMQLKIKNCNNIENGEFDITEGRLNICLLYTSDAADE